MRRNAVVVINEVVQRKDKTKTSAKRPHSLHRRENDIGVVLVKNERREGLLEGSWLVNANSFSCCWQELFLFVVANNKRCIFVKRR